ncbi:MAG: DUF4202 domain-containing protein [Balneolaceae bacterium]|nr:MAG: DUF4202 domain-containing protein [Balneolaceae bacterium]
MESIEKFQQAIQRFDDANSKDPNTDTVNGEKRPKELLYAERMTEWLDKMAPDASEALRLAARCQHIERWVIPREEYPMNRPGYIQWRNELKKYHAKRAEEILEEVGYDHETIGHVKKLVMKKGLKTDPEVQLLEDVICLVFLEYYYDEFAEKHEDEKIVKILQKTWQKMSEQGRETALTLDLKGRPGKLVEKALG